MNHDAEKSLEAIYPVIAARRTAYDTLMWRVPALGLTAQAFLLTIALGAESSVAARIFSGGLSVVVSLVSIQTMLKHQSNELTDSLILEQIEEALAIKIGRGSGQRPHGKPEVRGMAVGNARTVSRWVHLRSAGLWVASLSCFAIVGSAAMVLAVVAPGVLGN